MKVLSAIVALGRSTIGKIAQKTGMHRQSVKIILDGLVSKEIVIVEKEGNKYFYCSEDLDKVKNKFIKELEDVEEGIPSLKADYEDTKDTQIINVVSGRSGLRSVLMDEIIKGKEICAFHVSNVSDECNEEFAANDVRRIEHNVPLRLITSYDFSKKPLCDIKMTKMESKIDMFIYGNKLTLFHNDVDMKIFTMKIKEITNLFKDIFEEKWGS